MDCAIRTDDAMVSRHHARVFWGGGGYVLEDLQSANGVYFQEQRVQSHLFKHGDAIRCGSLWLRYVDTAQLGPSAGPAPMMQHPGMGAIAAGGPTGHQAAIPPNPQTPAMTPAHPPGAAMAALAGAAQNSEAEAEIRALRRRVEQLQTELRMYRSQRMSDDNVRRMEDLENDLSTLEMERDQLKQRLEQAEQALQVESGSVKVKRALEIAAMTAETAASLNDLISSLRIEVMAAEGEFDQYAQTIPRASFELIRQSLRDAAKHCDDARELLRKLREVVD